MRIISHYIFPTGRGGWLRCGFYAFETQFIYLAGIAMKCPPGAGLADFFKIYWGLAALALVVICILIRAFYPRHAVIGLFTLLAVAVAFFCLNHGEVMDD